MKFDISVSKFMESLIPVIDVATKNTVKDFESASMISINAYQDELVLIAHGGNACIQASLTNGKIDNLNYDCEEEGETIVEGKKLMTTLVSFPPQKLISVSINPNSASSDEESDKVLGEMEIVCDDTEMQSLPICKNEVNMPNISKDISTEIEVNREIFISGMHKVNFAVAIEASRTKYRCQVFDALKDGVKFIAGNGARFAIDEVEGCNLATVKSGSNRVIFPKMNISNIINCLKTSSAEKIVIKYGEATNENSEQIVLEFDDTVLVILGIDAALKDKYPDVNKILAHQHPFQFDIDIKEWVYPTKGIRATYSEEVKADCLIHNASIEVDAKKNKFIVKTDTNMKSKRTVQVETLKSEGDGKVKLLCNSMFLAEMVNQGYDSGDMKMRLIDNDAPIVVDYPEIQDGIRNTIEKYSIFFATAKKK